MHIIFTFDWVGWQTDEGLWANCITMLISCDKHVLSPTSEALAGEMAEKRMGFIFASVLNSLEPTEEQD